MLANALSPVSAHTTCGRAFDALCTQLGAKSRSDGVRSVVRMASGRLGVVVEQHPASLLTPRVKVFYSTKSQMRIVPETVDLAHPLCQDRIVAKDTAERYGIQHVEQLWATV